MGTRLLGTEHSSSRLSNLISKRIGHYTNIMNRQDHEIQIYSAFHKSACRVSLLFGALCWRYMIQSCILRMHRWLEMRWKLFIYSLSVVYVILYIG